MISFNCQQLHISDLFLAVLFDVTGLQVEALGYHLLCLSAARMNACLHKQV